MIRFSHRLRWFFTHAAAVLAAVCVFPVAGVLAAEPVIFQPAYAPAPADNPLKGFVPYAGQAKDFPHSMEIGRAHV